MFLIKAKSEVLEVFKRFETSTETESGKVIKILRTDGGGEYTSLAFDEFCKNEGIKHEVIAPYRPQHNGLIERRNHTVMNMVRCLIREKKLPQMLWAEAVSTVVYILNRCPTKKIEGKVPWEVWTGLKPSVSHLRVFGSLAYAHVMEQKRTKLEYRGETMVLMGYHDTWAYKLYDPRRQRMVLRIDVVIRKTNAGTGIKTSQA